MNTSNIHDGRLWPPDNFVAIIIIFIYFGFNWSYYGNYYHYTSFRVGGNSDTILLIFIHWLFKYCMESKYFLIQYVSCGFVRLLYVLNMRSIACGFKTIGIFDHLFTVFYLASQCNKRSKRDFIYLSGASILLLLILNWYQFKCYVLQAVLKSHNLCTLIEIGNFNWIFSSLGLLRDSIIKPGAGSVLLIKENWDTIKIYLNRINVITLNIDPLADIFVFLVMITSMAFNWYRFKYCVMQAALNSEFLCTLIKIDPVLFFQCLDGLRDFIIPCARSFLIKENLVTIMIDLTTISECFVVISNIDMEWVVKDGIGGFVRTDLVISNYLASYLLSRWSHGIPYIHMRLVLMSHKVFFLLIGFVCQKILTNCRIERVWKMVRLRCNLRL